VLRRAWAADVPEIVGLLADDLLGYVCTIGHHTDIGGRVAGGNASDSTEIYQEGLRTPPLRLYDRGELNDGFMRLLEKNVRIPVKVLGDLRAQVTAVKTGERRFLDMIGKYGRAATQLQAALAAVSGVGIFRVVPATRSTTSSPAPAMSIGSVSTSARPSGES